jgi:hypothetical protein
MKPKKNGIKLLVIAIVGTLFLIGVTGAQAAMMNWTETMYTASSGELTFTSDPNSQYELAPFEADVKADQIFIPPDNIVGTLYEFVIPNFYDPLPKKTVNVTISGGNGGASGLELARVIDVIGADTPFGNAGPAVPVRGAFVDGTINPEVVTELWEIFPNPDFEYVKIWAPVQFELESIKIATQSVPLPPAVLLLGSALFGMVFLRRKTR